MSIGSISSARISSQSLRINSSVSRDGAAELKEQITAAAKPDSKKPDQSKASEDTQSSKTTSSSASSSSSTDYASMTDSDLEKLVAKGDTKAQKELDKRAEKKLDQNISSSSNENSGSIIDIVA